MAAVSQAVAPGPQGVVALIGTAAWGPANAAEYIANQGVLEQTYSTIAEGTLHDAALDAFLGFDLGGATQVLAYRAAAIGTVATATCVLKDGSANPALTLVAKYPGDRPTIGWSVVVSTNPVNSGNKDLAIFENGVLLESYTNIVGGTAGAFAAAINNAIAAGVESYLAAANVSSGESAVALANVAGSVGGSGSFGVGSGGVAGNSGLTLTVGDITAALNVLGQYPFDAIALCDIIDGPTQTAFNAWLETYNQGTGLRTFGIIGGDLGEGLSTAFARSFGGAPNGNYNNPDLINLGVTDLRRLSDGVVFRTAKLAPKVAGALASASISRALTGITLSGYQVANAPAPATYVSALSEGVLLFENVDIDTIMISSDVTSLVNVATSPYVSDTPLHQKARNVAIDHFIQNSMKTVGQKDIGSLLNTDTGRKNFIGVVLDFLKALETQQVLEPGSTVMTDAHFQSVGTAMFLALTIQYIEAVERFLFTVRVS
jgi:hypothetical protein